MIKKPKRKKIYYVPGMISLVCIPLLCIGYFFYSGAFVHYGAISFWRPDKGGWFEKNVASLRKYKVFDFDKKVEEIKLNEFETFLKNTIKNRDTVNGAKVNLGNHTNYKTFIDVLDILDVNHVPAYGLFNDSFYILPSTYKTEKKTGEKIDIHICASGRYAREYQLSELERIALEEKFKLDFSLFKSQKLLFSGYFALVFINIFAFVKFNKNKFPKT